MSVDFVQDNMPVNSGNRRHVHPNHLKERLWYRLEKENIVQSPKSVPSVNPKLYFSATPSTAAIGNAKNK